MRVAGCLRALLLGLAFACGEPTLVGKRCTDDRPCPSDLVCSPEGRCVSGLDPLEALEVTVEGPGAGVVTSDPAGLRCEDICTAEFEAGARVVLTAHALPDSGFLGWRGACTGRGSCVIRMDEARSVNAVFGREVDHPWLVRFGGTGDDRITAVTVDPDGRAIAAGHFGSDVPFEGEMRTSAGGIDGFVAAVTGMAELAWVSTYGGAGDDAPLAVTTDLDGGAAVGGWFVGSADVFGEDLPGVGSVDPMVARLGRQGAGGPVGSFGSEAVDVVEDVAFDAEGGIYVAGWAGGPITADGVTYGHVGAEDAYLIHVESSGRPSDVDVYGGSGSDKALAVDLSPDGQRVAIFGTFQGRAAFGGMPLTSTSAYALFISVFERTSGRHVWSVSFDAGSAQEPTLTGRYDTDGNLIIAGASTDALDLGGGDLPGFGGQDGFVAKLDPDGGHIWSHRFGGSGDDLFFDVCVDRSGNVVLGGAFLETADFGGEDPLSSAGSFDGVVLKLDAQGAHVWSRRIGGDGVDAVLGIGLDPAGKVVAGGHFGGTVDFGTTVLTSAGMQDAFLMSLGR